MQYQLYRVRFNMNIAAVLLYFVNALLSANCYNYLFVNDFPTKSSFTFLKPIMKELTARGHNLTVITNFPLGEPLPNYEEILINGAGILSDEEIVNNLTHIESVQLLFRYITPLVLSEYSNKLCELLFTTKSIEDIYRKEIKFDAIFLHLFHSDCIFQIARRLGSPIIGFHSSILASWVADKLSLPLNPAVVPSMFLPYSTKMLFWERVHNSLLTWGHRIFNHLYMVPRDTAVVVKYFAHEEEDEVRKFECNISLVILNTHYTVNLPNVVLPNMVEIGGIHIGEAKGVPKDIEKWINESEHGVIYFSFGSLVKGHTMPAEKREAFIRAFKRLPQRVIWKWENETMEGKTDNILIGKWLPQFDILSHPNVKAFISHGGLLGTFEAVHCAVPMLVMPQFGDQHTNAKALETVGGGEILYLSDATEEKIYNALKKILSPSFQEQAQELSERFRDRPMSPLDTAIYWVEYVARHKGAHFMKTAAVGMPFYQYYLLDVIAFLLAVLAVFLYTTYMIIRFFFRLVFKSKSSNKKEKVKKS